MKTAGFRFTFTCIAAGLIATSAAAADYHISYFKEARSLSVDKGKLALFNDGVTANAGVAALAQNGIVATDIRDHEQVGWSTAITPGVDWSDAEYELSVKAVADQNAATFVSPVFIDDRGMPLIVQQDIFVRFQEGVSDETASKLIANYVGGFILDRNYGNLPRTYQVQSLARDGFTVLEQANKLAALPDVEFAEPNQILSGKVGLIPNDTFFNNLWGLNQGNDIDVDAPEAWDITTGDASVKVLVMDTGVQQNHPDINQDPGMDFLNTGNGGGPASSCDNHGTPVAGCITATINNNLGVVGVAPTCRTASAYVFAVDTMTCGPNGTAPTGALVGALAWAETIGVRVTNASLSVGPASTLSAKYQQTFEDGMLHFAATGNDGTSGIGYPANISPVMAVGAINQGGNRAGFSNFGSQIELVAPGVSITTTDRTGFSGYNTGDYTTIFGTSFASPYAAGVAALVFSLDQNLTAEQARFILQQTAVDRGAAGFDQFYGYGIVNAQAALDWVLNPPPVPGDFDLQIPADDATGVANPPAFLWDAAANTDDYEITIDDDPSFVNPEVQTTLFVNVFNSSPTLEPGRLYYWKVTARNAVGATQSNPTVGTFTTMIDCNNNGQDDAAEIAGGAPDCNENGIPDDCDIAAGNFHYKSLDYTPIDAAAPQAITIDNVPPANGDVTLTFLALSDINFSSELFNIDLDGTDIGDAFVSGFQDCSPNQMSALVVSAATFNAARVDNSITINVVPTAGVDTSICNDPSWVNVTLDYSADALSDDANMDDVPDECVSNCVCADSNCDGIVSVSDIGFFVTAVAQGEAAWNASFPGGTAPCDYVCANDTNGDLTVSVGDIGGFVQAVTGGGCP